MRRAIPKAIALLLAVAAVVSVLTVSAFAKGDKSEKSDKKVPSAASGAADIAPAQAGEAAGTGIAGAISREQACQIALDAAGLDGEKHPRHVACYISWADHSPYAYEVKFSTRTAYYHYTIDLDSGAILWDSCRPHR